MEEEKWMELGRKMLYDKDIREPLFDFLEETYGKVRILEEKTIGKSRADVVMVTPESLYGIEIKSDADTYVRLGKQVKDYNLFYDYNYVAVGTSHALHVEEHIPEWWGIITVEQAETMVDFYILRRPAKNPEMNWKKKLSILWRPELAHIQELNGLHKYKEKSKLFVMGRILEKVPEETLQRQLCEELFERDYTAITEEIRKYRRKNRRKNEK
jgi:3'-phosphoadenosine 5'-phosphosulfate sulfotransferase